MNDVTENQVVEVETETIDAKSNAAAKSSEVQVAAFEAAKDGSSELRKPPFKADLGVITNGPISSLSHADHLQYRIDPSISSILPGLSIVEDAQLEKEIREEKRVHTPVIVWLNPDDGNPTPILIDGKNRDRMHKKITGEGIELPALEITEMEFPNRLAAIQWMLTHQDGRRNWTAEQRAWSIIRNEELVRQVDADAKRRQGGQLASDDAKGKAAARLAAYVGVSQATIERARKNAKTIKQSGNDEIIRRCFNPATPDERMSFGEGAKQINRDNKEAKRKVIHDKAKDWELPPLDPNLKGTLDTIHLADVLDGLDMVQDNSVHLTVTSPPYAIPEIVYENVESNYGGYRAWLDQQETVWRKVYQKTAWTGRAFVNFDTSNNRDGVIGRPKPAI